MLLGTAIYNFIKENPEEFYKIYTEAFKKELEKNKEINEWIRLQR